MEITSEYKGILLILKAKFGKFIRQKHPGITEILTIIVFGHHLGQDTISAICERLKIPRHQIYNEIKKLSIRQWRKLFRDLFEEYGTEELECILKKSASTQSRAKIVLSVDDSVLRHWKGGALGYIGKWWSGQFKRLVLGQDVILITLKINNSVIPLCLWIMSKKGRCNKRKERVALLLEDLAKKWKYKGLDISKITVTADAGYAERNLIERIKKLGFSKIIVGVKKNYKIRSHRSKTKRTRQIQEILSDEKFEQAPDEAWAIDDKVLIYQAISPTFGRCTVLGRYMVGKMRYVYAFNIHRAAEIYGLWKAHYRIEQVFKRLKQYLAWGKSRLRGNAGAYANVILPFFAYFVVLVLEKKLKNVTFEKIIQQMTFWGNLEIAEILEYVNVEHLQCDFSINHSFSKN